MDPATPTRKIIQICAAGGAFGDVDGGTNIETELYALCDDGTVWYLTNNTRGWKEIIDVPQPLPAETETAHA